MIRGAPLAALKSSIAQMVFTVDFGKIRARLFPVGVQRLVAAVIQRLAGVQAGDFKIPVEDIATSGEDQRV